MADNITVLYHQRPAKPRLGIVIPCYNEQAVLPNALQKLRCLLDSLIANNKIAPDSFLYCVDDGSDDATWAVIVAAHQENSNVKGLQLAHNAGHQKALFSGLMRIKGIVDCAISIDADLQDDITVIEEMIDDYQQGSEVVYGVRKLRHKDTIFKRWTALIFYKLMQCTGANTINNHADFRLMSQRALNQLAQFKERNIFLRGLIPSMGFCSSNVYYDRADRTLGESKYTFRKMCSLAWDGITSFSDVPLHFIFVMGLLSFIFFAVLIVWGLCAKIFSHTVPGWTSTMIPICFMGGVQLVSIGVLGEYLAKIYIEVKHRPHATEEKELQ